MTNNYFTIYDLPTAIYDICNDIWASNENYCNICSMVAKFMVDNEVLALDEICGDSKAICKITVEKNIDIYNHKVYHELKIQFLPTDKTFVTYI